jgi:hypothetical protein
MPPRNCGGAVSVDHAGEFKQGASDSEAGRAIDAGRPSEEVGVTTDNRLQTCRPDTRKPAMNPTYAPGIVRLRRALGVTALSAGLLLAVVATSGVAAAQGHSRADEEACTPDVYRLCNDYVPNQARIVSCLRAKRGQLSPRCRAVMTRNSGSSSRRSSR